MSSDGNAPVREVEFGPAPDTLQLRDIPKADVFPEGGGGVHVLLTESVSDLTGAVPHHSSRLVRQVTSRDGLQHVARFDTVFDPRFERVVIHHIRVIRDGVVRDVARPDAFELMRREPNLERAIYDGRMTAHMVIPDVREGDVVDSCFSLIGEAPGLQNTFGWSFSLEWSVPVQETICRILAPADRKLRIRPWDGAPDPEIIERDGVREYVWSTRDSVARTPDPVSPIWSPGYAVVEAADDLSWQQVSAMFVDLYEQAIGTTLPEGLEADIETLVAAHPEPEAQAVEALRLVQRTLRYHSVAIGEGGYRPRPLATIWESRYGDCKDASVLLTAVLRRLGLKAVCALVHPARGPTVALSWGRASSATALCGSR